jgi:predicted nucleic acid-binding protein
LIGIADTGLLVAFANRGDRHHAWAVKLAETITEPLLTCESVLSEAAFHIGDPNVVLAMIHQGLIRLAFHAEPEIPRLAELASRYRDQNPDFADLCLIRMSELYPRHPVITVDAADFRVYKRNRRETIPLILPTP